MSSIGLLQSELAAPVFPRSAAGLWDAIVDQIAPRDPAGSVLVGPAWPGQPVRPEPGMFDFVVPSALDI